MGGSYCCIVACTHLGNGTSCRTATMVAPLLLSSGLAKYEVGLHRNSFYICVCEWMYAGAVWIESDKPESILHVEGQAQYVEGVYAGYLGVDPVCVEGVCRDGLG